MANYRLLSIVHDFGNGGVLRSGTVRIADVSPSGLFLESVPLVPGSPDVDRLTVRFLPSQINQFPRPSQLEVAGRVKVVVTDTQVEHLPVSQLEERLGVVRFRDCWRGEEAYNSPDGGVTPGPVVDPVTTPYIVDNFAGPAATIHGRTPTTVPGGLTWQLQVGKTLQAGNGVATGGSINANAWLALPALCDLDISVTGSIDHVSPNNVVALFLDRRNGGNNQLTFYGTTDEGGGTVLLHWIGGVASQLFRGDINPGTTPHTYRAVRKGDKVRVYFDGTLQHEATIAPLGVAPIVGFRVSELDKVTAFTVGNPSAGTGTT